MSQDPWANAATNTKAPEGSQLDEAFEGEGVEEESLLFAQKDRHGPSLFLEQHRLGHKLTGTVIAAPTDIHAGKVGNPRVKLYWQEGDKKPVENAINPVTGEKNNRVMTTLVKVQTEYRFSSEELIKRKMTPGQDDGKRTWYISNSREKAAIFAAISDAGIKSGKEMVGMTLTVWRSGEKPSGEAKEAWLYTATLSR